MSFKVQTICVWSLPLCVIEMSCAEPLNESGNIVRISHSHRHAFSINVWGPHMGRYNCGGARRTGESRIYGWNAVYTWDKNELSTEARVE